MRKAVIPEGYLPNAPPAPQTDADKNTKQVHRGTMPAADSNAFTPDFNRFPFNGFTYF
jgi:hypothetical protein